MNALEIILWIIIGSILYTYIGYPVILRILVFVKELVSPRKKPDLPKKLPSVTLFISAYNQENLVDLKMQNSLALDYPNELLTIRWVTDGSTDLTNNHVAKYSEAILDFIPENKGKCAAMNRAIQNVDTDITIFTDAATMLNRESITEMVKQFARPKVGCVLGSKQASVSYDRENITSAGAISYWKYESLIKDLGSRLYSGVCASEGLYAIRTELYRPMLLDTMHDDLCMSMKLAMDGKVTAYTPHAYGITEMSSDTASIRRRAIKHTAGWVQSMTRLRKVFNPINHGIVSLEYLLHRVLRMTIVPILVLLALPVNIAVVAIDPSFLTVSVLIAQVGFNLAAFIGYQTNKHGIKIRIFRIPYFFWFMNLNVIRCYSYLKQRNESEMWRRPKRAYY